jgi:hypothetical protein
MRREVQELRIEKSSETSAVGKRLEMIADCYRELESSVLAWIKRNGLGSVKLPEIARNFIIFLCQNIAPPVLVRHLFVDEINLHLGGRISPTFTEHYGYIFNAGINMQEFPFNSFAIATPRGSS